MVERAVWHTEIDELQKKWEPWNRNPATFSDEAPERKPPRRLAVGRCLCSDWEQPISRLVAATRVAAGVTATSTPSTAPTC